MRNPSVVRAAGGGVKDVPFFPYAPYTPQTEMSITGASFSRKRVQLPPVVEENQHDEDEETVDDNETVHPCIYTVLHMCFLYLHRILTTVHYLRGLHYGTADQHLYIVHL